MTDLLSLAVRVTAVVDEARHISASRCVYDFVSVEGHEVVVLLAGLGVLLRAAFELAVVQHLPYILHHELTTVTHKTCPGEITYFSPI